MKIHLPASAAISICLFAILGKSVAQAASLRGNQDQEGESSDLAETSQKGGSGDLAETNKSNAKLLIPFQTGHKIGDGVDVMTGRSRYATFDYVKTDRLDQFQQQMHFLTTSSTEEMKTSTETLIKAEASAFGATVSGSMNWIANTDVSAEAINLIMGSTVKAYTETIDARTIGGVDESLLADLRLMKKERRLQDFVAKYGTHYISGMQFGGSVYSRISITTETRTDKEEIKRDVQASFKAVSFSGSAQFKQELKKVQSTKNVKITSSSYLEGTPLPGLGSSDIDHVLKALDNFGKEIDERERNSMPLYVICDEWETIREIRDILGEETLLPFVQASTIRAITQAHTSLEYASQLAMNVKSGRHPMWKDMPSWIVDSKDTQVDETFSKIRGDLARIEDLSYAELAKLNPASPKFVKDFLQAPAYEKALDVFADGNMYFDWRFTPAAEVKYAGPTSGRTLAPWKMLHSGYYGVVITKSELKYSSGRIVPFVLVAESRRRGPEQDVMFRVAVSFDSERLTAFGEFLDNDYDESVVEFGHDDISSYGYISYI